MGASSQPAATHAKDGVEEHVRAGSPRQRMLRDESGGVTHHAWTSLAPWRPGLASCPHVGNVLRPAMTTTGRVRPDPAGQRAGMWISQMQTITATVPVTLPPSWATQQRLLLSTMSDSGYPFLDRYTHDDGELIYDDSWGGGADDFYEGYTNWPLLYLVGGGDNLVDLSHRGWETVTRQLTRRGQAHKEYARSMDTFHQSESDVLFYYLCLADPGAGQLHLRARRFAGFFLSRSILVFGWGHFLGFGFGVFRFIIRRFLRF